MLFSENLFVTKSLVAVSCQLKQSVWDANCKVRDKVKFCRNWDISYSNETIFLFKKQIIQQQKHREVTIVK